MLRGLRESGGLFLLGEMMKAALLIDGGHLRASAKEVGKNYDAALVTTFAHACILSDEYLFRILYYDAPPYDGRAKKPVSGKWTVFKPTDTLLDDLERTERFACRRGSLGFRGWKPRVIPLAGGKPLTDADFKPIFEQKGVDMRVGLDIAAFAHYRSVERILLASADQDMIPAMKHGRRAGLEIGMIQIPPPALALHDNMLAHSDFVRTVALP